MAEYFKKVPYKQDLPPPGGYKKITIEKHLPKRGPSGVMLMAGGVAFMAVGFYFVIKGNQNRRELVKEQKKARLSLLPLLQAEQDRWTIRRLKENLETEKQVMKDVKDWNVGESVYNTKRWVAPRGIELEKL